MEVKLQERTTQTKVQILLTLTVVLIVATVLKYWIVTYLLSENRLFLKSFTQNKSHFPPLGMRM